MSAKFLRWSLGKQVITYLGMDCSAYFHVICDSQISYLSECFTRLKFSVCKVQLFVNLLTATKMTSCCLVIENTDTVTQQKDPIPSDSEIFIV